jgi:hypothetical protein
MKLILSIACVAALVCATQSYAASSSFANAEQGQYQGQGQDQIQGQGQGQGQSQQSIQANAQLNNQIITFEGSKPIRSMPIPSPVEVSYRGGPAMFSRPEQDKGPNFVSVIDLVSLLNAASIDENLDAEDIDMSIQMLNASDTPTAPDTPVSFSIVGQGGVYAQGFQPIAIISMKTGKEINSALLAAALSNKCHELGGTKVTFIREGVVRELSSWGVGIGASFNYAHVGSDWDDNGSVGAGGTGWSMGKAKYVSFPYLTAVVGK